MTPDEFFFVALTPSADHASAQLARILLARLGVAEAGYSEETQPLYASLAPRFYGVGGPEMAAMGLKQINDKSGPSIWSQLQSNRDSNAHHILAPIYKAALQQQPHVIVCVGESPVHPRLADKVRSYIEARQGLFFNWDPVFVRIGLAPANSPSRTTAKTDNTHFDCDLVPNEAGERDLIEEAALTIMRLLHQRRAGHCVA